MIIKPKLYFKIDYRHDSYMLKHVKTLLSDVNIDNYIAPTLEQVRGLDFPIGCVFIFTEDSNNLVSISSDEVNIKLESTNIFKLCDRCLIATYGRVDFDVLRSLCNKNHEEVCNFLTKYEINCTIIYISLHTNYIYIAKDSFGFKSMLVSLTSNSMVISNTCTNVVDEWYEMPPFKFMVMGRGATLIDRRCYFLNNSLYNNFINYRGLELDVVLNAISNVKCALVNSVINICAYSSKDGVVTILFSGGLDSALIAVIVASYVNCNIELVNISFDPEFAPDRITALITYEELIILFPSVKIDLIFIDLQLETYKNDEGIIHSLSFPNNTHMDMNISAALYYASRLEGYLCSRDFFKGDYWKDFKNNRTVLKSINFKVTVSKDTSKLFRTKELKSSNGINMEMPKLKFVYTYNIIIYSLETTNYLEKVRFYVVLSGCNLDRISYLRDP